MKRAVIFIDGSSNDTDSLSTATLFCARLGARLNVVHPRQPRHAVMAVSVDAVVDTSEAASADSVAARRAYDAVCGGLDYASWIEIEGDLLGAIRYYGLYHDATVIERVSAEQGAEVQALNTALFETGAPVLVTPPRAPRAVGASVAVAWSGTAQAARAVRAALPVLRKAERTVVLADSSNELADSAGIAEYLRAHGIGAEARPFDGGQLTARGRGRALLAAVAETGADLLVMGAHGEYRLDSLFGLGRATRKVVTACPVPILLQS